VIPEIDSATLASRMDADDDVYLVDIRTPAEVAQGAIPGSVHLPMHLIPLRLGDLPRDRDVVLYCRSGARSYHACAFLAQQGFANVVNLRGGIIAWVRDGFQIQVGAQHTKPT
jgi:rhodanese-related sulfurtransferase